MALHIDLTHVDDALKSQHGTDRGGGNAVLPGAGLGNDTLLTHALRQQPLPERVVDFVGAGMGEVLSLEVDLDARGDRVRKARHVVERGWAPNETV